MIRTNDKTTSEHLPDCTTELSLLDHMVLFDSNVLVNLFGRLILSLDVSQCANDKNVGGSLS